MKPLDLAAPVLTPEGSTLILRPAGVPVRGAAWALDTLLRACVYIIVFTPLALLGQSGMGLIMLILFLGEWWYFAYCEAFRSGATPGKRYMGIKVVRQDGGPVGMEAAMIRNLIRFVDALPVLYGAGLISSLSSPTFQRLGDRVAGTLVIHAEQDPATSSLTRADRLANLAQRRANQTSESSPEEPIDPLQPPEALNGREAAALIAFAERRTYLHPQRQTELAHILTPLTEQREQAALDCLQAYALWLEGEE